MPTNPPPFPSFFAFLDAFSHLYKRVCPSVGRSVGWSVGWSVRHARVETMQKSHFLLKLLPVQTRTHLMPCIRPCSPFKNLGFRELLKLRPKAEGFPVFDKTKLPKMPHLVIDYQFSVFIVLGQPSSYPLESEFK